MCTVDITIDVIKIHNVFLIYPGSTFTKLLSNPFKKSAYSRGLINLKPKVGDGGARCFGRKKNF